MRNSPRPDQRRTFQGPGSPSTPRSERRHHREEQHRGQGRHRPQRPTREDRTQRPSREDRLQRSPREDRPKRPSRLKRNQSNPEMQGQGPPPHVRGNRQNRPKEDRENRRRRQHKRAHHSNFGSQNPMRLPMQRNSRMRHFFDRGFTDGKRNPKRGRSRWNPPVEFSVYEDRFEVKVELPGVKQEKIKVSTTDKVLIVRGEKKRGESDEKRKVMHSDLRYGKFRRILPLPPHANTDGINAKFKDGVLTIVISKTEDAKPKEVPINTDD